MLSVQFIIVLLSNWRRVEKKRSVSEISEDRFVNTHLNGVIVMF